MENNYTHMAERLTAIEGEVSEIREGVRDIQKALKGDDYEKEGLITKVVQQRLKIDTLEAELRRIDEKHERRFDRIKYWLIGLSIGAGFGITKLVDLFSHLIDK